MAFAWWFDWRWWRQDLAGTHRRDLAVAHANAVARQHRVPSRNRAVDAGLRGLVEGGKGARVRDGERGVEDIIERALLCEIDERIEMTKRELLRVEARLAVVGADRETAERRAAGLRETAVRDLARVDASLTAATTQRERFQRRLRDERERIERLRVEASRVEARQASALEDRLYLNDGRGAF